MHEYLAPSQRQAPSPFYGWCLFSLSTGTMKTFILHTRLRVDAVYSLLSKSSEKTTTQNYSSIFCKVQLSVCKLVLGFNELSWTKFKKEKKTHLSCQGNSWLLAQPCLHKITSNFKSPFQKIIVIDLLIKTVWRKLLICFYKVRGFFSSSS